MSSRSKLPYCASLSASDRQSGLTRVKICTRANTMPLSFAARTRYASISCLTRCKPKLSTQVSHRPPALSKVVRTFSARSAHSLKHRHIIGSTLVYPSEPRSTECNSRIRRAMPREMSGSRISDAVSALEGKNCSTLPFENVPKTWGPRSYFVLRT